MAVTVATVLGFDRVFDGPEYLVPLLVVAAVGHGLSWAARRRGLGVAVAAVIAVPVFALVASWLFFWSTTLPVIPGPDTWAATSRAFSDAWATFQTIVPPAPTDTGFVLSAAIAVYFAVFLADWAAFRLWSALEALVPVLTLFVFCALFGAGDQRELSTGLFAATALVFLLLHRTARLESNAGWLTNDVTRGSDAAVRVGFGIAAVAVLAGTVVGPHLPSAQSPQVIPWKGDGRNPVRTVISPLVNIKDRLLNQSDTEMFTVEADGPAYWRLMSLDTFDDESWRINTSFESASGSLVEPPPAAAGTELRQTFRISGLSSEWVPVAYVPTQLEDTDRDLSFQPESATLIVPKRNDEDPATSDGMTYTVVSRVPSYDVAALDAFRLDDLDDATRDKYLQLPDDFSPTARRTAEQVTAGAESPYAKALALENFFSGPDSDFRYSQQVPAGHGESAIENFLNDRQGYCEQFAGTYAAMARAVGLPTRLAVGFTPGVQTDPDNPRHWQVTGRYAHAWPEVYFGPDLGWVYFEPTPERGAPGSEQWTERDARQANPVGPSDSADTIAPGAVTSTVPPTSAGPGATTDPGQIATGPSPTTTTTAPAGPADEAPAVLGLSSPAQVARTVVITLVVLAAVVGAYAGAMVSLRSARRRRRRERARDASAEVLVRWQECLEHLGLFGLRQQRAETPAELAGRAEPFLGERAGDLHDLAAIVDAAAFAPDVLDPAEAGRAAELADAIERHVHEHTTTLRQWQERLDPRTVLAERV